MSDPELESDRPSLGLILWGIAALLIVFAFLGMGGIFHLTVWILVIALLFGIGIAGVALVMRLFGG